MSVPTDANSISVIGALVNGDTYTASTLPKIFRLNFVHPVPYVLGISSVIYRFVNFAAAVGGGNVNLDRCVVTASNTLLGRRYQNCGFFAGINFQGPGMVVSGVLQYGMMKGAGGSAITSFLGGWFQIGGVTYQGTGFSVGQQANVLQAGRVTFHDTGTRLYLLRDSAKLTMLVGADTSSGIGGKGNVGFIWELKTDAQVLYTASIAPPAVAGSTTAVNQIQLSNNLAAPLPLTRLPIRLNSSGQCVTATDEAVPLPGAFISTEPALGVVTVAITNAPAGSPAVPVRYAKIADGAGGFYTVPSLT